MLTMNSAGGTTSPLLVLALLLLAAGACMQAAEASVSGVDATLGSGTTVPPFLSCDADDGSGDRGKVLFADTNMAAAFGPYGVGADVFGNFGVVFYAASEDALVYRYYTDATYETYYDSYVSTQCTGSPQASGSSVNVHYPNFDFKMVGGYPAVCFVNTAGDLYFAINAQVDGSETFKVQKVADDASTITPCHLTDNEGSPFILYGRVDPVNGYTDMFGTYPATSTYGLDGHWNCLHQLSGLYYQLFSTTSASGYHVAGGPDEFNAHVWFTVTTAPRWPTDKSWPVQLSRDFAVEETDFNDLDASDNNGIAALLGDDGVIHVAVSGGSGSTVNYISRDSEDNEIISREYVSGSTGNDVHAIQMAWFKGEPLIFFGRENFAALYMSYPTAAGDYESWTTVVFRDLDDDVKSIGSVINVDGRLVVVYTDKGQSLRVAYSDTCLYDDGAEYTGTGTGEQGPPPTTERAPMTTDETFVTGTSFPTSTTSTSTSTSTTTTTPTSTTTTPTSTTTTTTSTTPTSTTTTPTSTTTTPTTTPTSTTTTPTYTTMPTSTTTTPTSPTTTTDPGVTDTDPTTGKTDNDNSKDDTADKGSAGGGGGSAAGIATGIVAGVLLSGVAAAVAIVVIKRRAARRSVSDLAMQSF